MSQTSNSMWGGRFKTISADITKDYTCSVDYDKKLYKQDIAGSKAHLLVLLESKILTNEEAEKITQGFEAIQKEIEAGLFVWKNELEDVHMNIESRLTELIGDTAKKLHTGRSRNDQVALDFRLFVADSLEIWIKELKNTILALSTQAEIHINTLLPGTTHFQPAQPVSLAHHLLAYAQMFSRDITRLKDALKRIRISPLGAAALSGTTYNFNPQIAADNLNFDSSFENSMDAVSDRDFVLEPLFAASLIMMHLSRICEEIIIWSNPAFNFIKLPDRFSTGSSIMPQKKNPDVAEIMRGKTGRVYGSLITLLTIMKGLPLTYNRDMQEDKEGFFDTNTTISMSLNIMSQMIPELTFNQKAMHKALRNGYLNATELADYLATKGIPFREAHHLTGAIVSYAEQNKKCLEDLSLEEMQEISPIIANDVFIALNYETAVARRASKGGTSPQSVRKQIQIIKQFLKNI